MAVAEDPAMDLVVGRWRSQTLYAGVELGVFEGAAGYPKHAVEIADQFDIDRDLGYRLLGAPGSLGRREESADLLAAAGREHVETHYPENELEGAVEAVPT